MKSITICISLTADFNPSLPPAEVEQEYDQLLKKIISFLYANPADKVLMYFSGPQLEWLKRMHPEFIQLLRELVSRKQIELLGGGYYNPAFPLLFSQDRNGQIEMLTSDLSRLIGKRPRGAFLFGSIWNSAIVPNLATTGMEYAVLDSSLIAPTNRRFVPLVASEQGKLVKILPAYTDLLPAITDESATVESVEAYIEHLVQTVTSALPHESEHAIFCLPFTASQFAKLIDASWFEYFFGTIAMQFTELIYAKLPNESLAHCDYFIPAYIAAGLSPDIAKWAKIPYSQSENTTNFPVTVHDFLANYPRNRALYNRILYISTLIGQIHGDKIRKQQARERLWRAQAAEAIVCNPNGIFASNAMRQNAYRQLTEAEKLLRECASKGEEFKETVTCYDYNADGHNEYMCRMKQYTACISKHGGCITELDIMQNTGNYADNLCRIAQFDGVTDHYERGFFVEHLFTDEEYALYSAGKPSDSGIFSTMLFKETNFESARHELRLRAEGEFGTMRLPVSLRKHYSANSSSITVQYILRNESPLYLRGKLIVESNFAQTDFSDAALNSYQVELISQGQRYELDVQKNAASLTSISDMKITDNSNDISFVYELNEDATVTCMPLHFYRPREESQEPQIAGTTFVASLCWDVDLAAGREMEKNVKFTIYMPKKRRGSKK